MNDDKDKAAAAKKKRRIKLSKIEWRNWDYTLEIKMTVFHMRDTMARVLTNYHHANERTFWLNVEKKPTSSFSFENFYYVRPDSSSSSSSSEPIGFDVYAVDVDRFFFFFFIRWLLSFFDDDDDEAATDPFPFWADAPGFEFWDGNGSDRSFGTEFKFPLPLLSHSRNCSSVIILYC